MARALKSPPGLRPAWAEVDLEAIRHNAREVVRVTGTRRLCAVVKADGYGHGAPAVARAALEGGASWLAVALVEEAAVLRGEGIDAPILVLSEPPPEAMGVAAGLDLRVTLYTDEGVAAAAQHGLRAHLKVDTGMHRVGISPERALRLASLITAHPSLELEAVWTHFAVADEPERSDATAKQIERFDDVVARIRSTGIEIPMLHTANTAGALMVGARYDMVRVGLGLYGYHPNPAQPTAADLRPALSLKARVSHVKRLPAGEAMSYGLRYTLDRDATVATAPLGYADGVPRRLSAVGGQVLVAGQRRAIAGTVTMDQILVDCDDLDVRRGDEVVLLGRQGDQVITADDWAERLDTISYEVLCGIGARVPRVHVG
ncbi:MAG TPA: alanine racemase [Acidimicrobiales bacterium]|nr:alanine racemase [Acidimicrobiales bacterium]